MTRSHLTRLLQRSASIHEKKDLVLHYAAAWGRMDVVTMLLEHSADLRGNDDNALRTALKHRHFHIARVFLERGPDVHA